MVFIKEPLGKYFKEYERIINGGNMEKDLNTIKQATLDLVNTYGIKDVTIFIDDEYALVDGTKPLLNEKDIRVSIDY